MLHQVLCCDEIQTLSYIQQFQLMLSEEKQKADKPRLQGNVGFL